MKQTVIGSAHSSNQQLKPGDWSWTAIGAWSSFQPPCSAKKLQTQAVFKPDEQWGDLSVTHRSSDVGDAPGTSANDPRYTNIFAELMSWYMKARSIKGHAEYWRKDSPWSFCHTDTKMDITRLGLVFKPDLLPDNTVSLLFIIHYKKSWAKSTLYFLNNVCILKNAHDRVSKEELWFCMRKSGVA